MRTSITKEVTVDVDIDDILEDLSGEELAELGVIQTMRDELSPDRLAEHGLFVQRANVWQDVRVALLRGDLSKSHDLIAQIADEQAGVLLIFDRTPLRRIA